MSRLLTKSMRNCTNVLCRKYKSESSHKNGQNDLSKAYSSKSIDDVKSTMSESVSPTLRKVMIIPGKGLPPEAPTTCCMSGCPTCVWLEYAALMTDYYRDGGTAALKAIEQIDDENVKSFIKLELKLK